MDDTARVASRRATVALAYGVATALLLQVVSGDLPWISETLARVGASVPADVRIVDDPETSVVLATGGVATALAVGTFLVSRRTATAFGLLVAGTIGWLAFPYAEVPWSAVLRSAPNRTFQAPASVWVWAGVLAVLATVEIGLSARDRVRQRLRGAGLDLDEGGRSIEAGWAPTAWVFPACLGGILVALLFAAIQPVAQSLVTDPDLLWVPALVGLLAGGVLWLTTRPE